MGIPRITGRTRQTLESMAPFFEHFGRYQEQVALAGPDACDFVYGNPHEMPLPGVVDAIGRVLPPQDEYWFAYKINEPRGQEVIAEALRLEFNRPFVPNDIFITNGATGALMLVFNTVLDPGDEVIFISPPWFFYEAYIQAAGGVPVRVKIDPATFDLDLAAIEAAVTPKTRLLLVNSPNNPTGKIYPPATLQAIGALLARASARNGRPIYLLSDEAYRRILFDGHTFPSPTSYYPESFVVYTYGKTLLIPGQRLDYAALSPEMANREAMRPAVLATQVACGLATANALMQYALGDLQRLSIDLEHLQEKRDRLVGGLREAGYEVHVPEGTFYLLPRSPWADDVAFCDRLAENGVFCLPGQVAEMPGYFRISLTANMDMIERALPRFAAAAG